MALRWIGRRGPELLPWLLALALAWPGSARAAATAERPADWFRVDRLDEHTYAIVEPQYWQFNVSYLLVGATQALLYDTGPGVYRLRDLVGSLTTLPVLVVPSHLHFDHVGRAAEFDALALPDRPDLRARTRNGVFEADAEQFLLAGGTRFPVARWLADGEVLDLGGRTLRVVHTPGHTPDSISLIDGAHRRLFLGDLVNRDITLAVVPGSDTRAMAASLRRLLALAPAGSEAREAHSDKPLAWRELQALAAGLARIVAGESAGGHACLGNVPMVRHDIGAFPVLVPGHGDGRLPPFVSPAAELDWLGSDCPGRAR